MTTPQDQSTLSCICGKVDCAVPFGFCHCGCGLRTTIAKYTSRRDNWIKGIPAARLKGHGNYLRLRVPEDAVPFKIGGVYCRLIPLTKGMYAIVDAVDYKWLAVYRWKAMRSKNGKFYAVRTKCSRNGSTVILMHREILGLRRGDKRQGDHKESNATLDNRRGNLRIATRFQNAQNSHLDAANTSGYKGASWNSRDKLWYAQIKVNGEKHFLGCRKTALEAHELYKAAAEKYHREFAAIA